MLKAERGGVGRTLRCAKPPLRREVVVSEGSSSSEANSQRAAQLAPKRKSDPMSQRALVCTQLGPWRKALELVADFGDDSAGPDAETLRVRVKTVGVSLPDVLICEGAHFLKKQPPFVPGLEVCGTVVAVGTAAEPGGAGGAADSVKSADAAQGAEQGAELQGAEQGAACLANRTPDGRREGFRVGDVVCGTLPMGGSGGLCEFVSLPKAAAYHVPRGVRAEVAAGFEMNYGTAYGIRAVRNCGLVMTRV